MNNSASKIALQFLDMLINKWNIIQRLVHDYKDPLIFPSPITNVPLTKNKV